MWINLTVWVRLLWEVKEVWLWCMYGNHTTAQLICACVHKCAFQTTEEKGTLRQADAQ